MPVNDYDKASRRMVKAAPDAFLGWLFMSFDAVARRLGWVDTRRLAFPGNPDQTGDLVFELETLKDIGPPWAVALEFQLEPDPKMFGWLLVFLGTISNERWPDEERGSRYRLGAVVVNLTGTPASIPASAFYTWPGQPEMVCGLKAPERYLAMESAELLLEAIRSGEYDRALLPWLPLMKGGSEPAVIAGSLGLAREVADERWRADFGYDTLVFAEKSADPAAWRKALEGWEMVKSPVMEKSRAEGEQASLLLFLRARTKQEPPEDLAEKIRSTTDRERLQGWITLAATADTIDTFRQQAGI